MAIQQNLPRIFDNIYPTSIKVFSVFIRWIAVHNMSQKQLRCFFRENGRVLAGCVPRKGALLSGQDRSSQVSLVLLFLPFFLWQWLQGTARKQVPLTLASFRIENKHQQCSTARATCISEHVYWGLNYKVSSFYRKYQKCFYKNDHSPYDRDFSLISMNSAALICQY